MSSYTCISCRVQFADAELQRAHYKTDWHRYNLKRKVASMPPVTAENFQERVLAQRAAAEQQQADGHNISTCATCSKRFSTANAYANHLQSHKHVQAERSAVATAHQVVERMNQKNLEKGAELDKDARNEALQRALKDARRGRGGGGDDDGGGGGGLREGVAEPVAGRKRPKKAPRLEWFERQAKKIADEEDEDEEDENEGECLEMF